MGTAWDWRGIAGAAIPRDSLSLCSLPARAQMDPARSDPWLSGARVRLTMANHEQLSGTVVAFRADSIVLSDNSSAIQSLARADVTRIERSTGSRRYLMRGATIGFLVGGVLGGVTAGEDVRKELGPCGTDPLCATAEGIAFVAAAFGGGLMGSVVGLLIGSRSHEQWTSVGGGTDVRVTIAPASGNRVALSVSLRR